MIRAPTCTTSQTFNNFNSKKLILILKKQILIMKKTIKINTAIGGKFNKDSKQKNGLTIDNNTPAVIINNKKYLLAKLIDGNMVAINVLNFHIDYLINSSYEIQIEIKTNKIN